MRSERWRRIEELYHAALDQDISRRAAFVDAACQGDEELRREVESLLAAGHEDDGRFDSPAWDGAANLLEDAPAHVPLPAGKMLGPYEIVALLGHGGMGEVYRALDHKLNRPCAVKILPQAFAGHTDRIERLKKEARVLAALNHPNIAAVYDLQELEGHCFVVLEFVPGRTLSLRMTRGALAVRDALSICRQVAEALEAAHDKGVIHRDLKPGNIMVTPEGRVKLVDFGIAITEVRPEPGDESATRTEFTLPGLIAGTVSYMSPEQARGRALDKRSDIWSFGCVLYETLTGRRLFTGQTFSDTVAAILRDQIELDDLPESTPAGVRRLLKRCLRPSSADRLRDIGDARIEIDEALLEPTEAAVGVQAARAARWRTGAIAFAATALAAVLLATWFLQVRSGRQLVQTIRLLRLTDAVGLEESPAISPDGKSAAFVATSGGKRQIWLRLLAGGPPLVITKDDADHSGPRWSPDSASLIYYTSSSKTGRTGHNLGNTGPWRFASTVDASSGSRRFEPRRQEPGVFSGPQWNA